MRDKGRENVRETGKERERQRERGEEREREREGERERERNDACTKGANRPHRPLCQGTQGTSA